jgi:hypothetical protein
MTYWCTHCGRKTNADAFTSIDARYAIGVCHTTEKPMRRHLVNSEARALAIVVEHKAMSKRRREARKAVTG